MADPEKAAARAPSPTISSIRESVSARTDDSQRSSPVEVQEDDVQALTPQLSRQASAPAALRVTTGADAAFEVDWEGEEDTEDPTNWPTWYKGVVTASVSFATVVVVLYSTSYTLGIVEMESDFHISSEPVITLGVTVYLVGLAAGSMILAPISELYGRRPVYMGSLFVFMVLIIPCGLASSLQEVLVARFFGALAGSAMIANAPGTLNDMVTEEYRALAFSVWSLGPLNGPVLGPVLGGFVSQYLGFRWTNWVVMALAAAAWVTMCCIRETYPPVLLSRRAASKRTTTGDPRWWCRYEQRASLGSLLATNLTRPFVMAVTEPICVFWNLYIGVIYAIMYMCFVAYPIVFIGIRGWSLGLSGLSFVGLGIGATLVIAAEPLIRRWINSHPRDPLTGRPAPEASVSVVCAAAVLAPLGQMWFAWTCAPPVHWAWPIAAGVPFGAANAAVFIYASAYLTSAYGIYTASALAGNAVVRSLLGGTLPLAGPAMYAVLGPHWAGATLAFCQVAIIPIPVVFYLYGGRIRERSALIARMRADKERLDGKRARREERAEEAVMEAGMAGVVENDVNLDLAVKRVEGKEAAV